MNCGAMFTISWYNNVKNRDVFRKISAEKPQFHRYTERQKLRLRYVEHELRGSSKINVMLMLEGRINGGKSPGQTRRNWTDDIKE